MGALLDIRDLRISVGGRALVDGVDITARNILDVDDDEDNFAINRHFVLIEGFL